MLSWPCRAARERAVLSPWSSGSRTSPLIPCSKSNCTISWCPFSAAFFRASSPCWPVVTDSAWLSRISTISRWPFFAACTKAVSPWWLTTSKSAPLAKRRRTISLCPLAAARDMAVSPSDSALIFAPRFNWFRTEWTSPSSAHETKSTRWPIAFENIWVTWEGCTFNPDKAWRDCLLIEFHRGDEAYSEIWSIHADAILVAMSFIWSYPYADSPSRGVLITSEGISSRLGRSSISSESFKEA